MCASIYSDLEGKRVKRGKSLVLETKSYNKLVDCVLLLTFVLALKFHFGGLLDVHILLSLKLYVFAKLGFVSRGETVLNISMALTNIELYWIVLKSTEIHWKCWKCSKSAIFNPFQYLSVPLKCPILIVIRPLLPPHSIMPSKMYCAHTYNSNCHYYGNGCFRFSWNWNRSLMTKASFLQEIGF